MKVLVAQLNLIVGDFSGNAQKIIDALSRGRKEGADVVLFSELTLSAYPPEDLVLHDSFIQEGEEALQKIKSERPGVIVLDLILPKLDGFAVLQNLQNLPDALARTPVVILSNLPDSKNLSQDPNFNVEAYYTKSGTALDTVIDKVDRIFAEQAG